MESAGPITTERLQIVPATDAMVRAALAGTAALGAALGAVVPASWPPEYLEGAYEFTRARYAEGPEQHGWWMHFVLLRGAAGGRTLIGTGGYKGPPAADGTVEVGYSIVSDLRRKGYATEVVHGLLGRAFARPEVRRVIAETLPELAPSIGVLRKCGFRPIGEGSEPGVIRFELLREEHAAERHAGPAPAG